MTENSPKSLDDLCKGRNVSGKQFSNSDPLVAPRWFDSDRFDRGRKFFHDYFVSVLFSYFMALLIGFAVPNLSAVLIYTGESLTPEKSRKRYLDTLAHLLVWHEEFVDIFDPETPANKSLTFVRKWHDRVREKMTKDAGRKDDEIFISQYDLALTQSGFVGLSILYPTSFGNYSSHETLADYVYFWRVIGYFMGLEDGFNMCSSDFLTVRRICYEIEQTVVVPGLEKKSEDYERLSNDFMAGFKVKGKGRGPSPFFPWVTKNICFAFLFPGMGLSSPQLTLKEWILLQLLKLHFWVIGSFSWYRNFCNDAAQKALSSLKPTMQ